MKTQGGFLIAKIHQVAGRIFSKMLRDHDIEINPAQGRILFALWDQDGIPIQELAHRTALGKSTLTSMLDRLEAAGYVERSLSRKDRRKILIRRTDKDRDLSGTYLQVSEEMVHVFYRGFSDEEIHRFETYLSRVFANLESFESAPEALDS